MTDYGALGGVQPLRDRTGQNPSAPHPRTGGEAAPRRGGDQGPSPAADSAELVLDVHAAYALLEQRVLAATRRLVPGFGAQIGVIVRSEPPATPAAASARLHSAQHWGLRGCTAEPEVLAAAFVIGRDETLAILADVAPAATAVAAFIAAIEY